jgi:hypothetical protein
MSYKLQIKKSEVRSRKYSPFYLFTSLPLYLLTIILNSQFSILNCSAQTDPPLRIELESAKDQQDYHFFQMAQQGVAVFYQSAILSVDTVQWVFIHYDTNLVRTNIYKIKLPNLCQYLAADFSNDKLYLFLQKPAYKKDTLKNYLLEWNLCTENFQLFDLQNYKSPYLSSIKVADDYLFMIIDAQKTKSIIYYNYKTDTKQWLQFTEDEITSIESFGIDTIKKETHCCLFLKNKKNSRAELFITDYSGKMKGGAILPFHTDIVYNSAKVTVSGKDSLLVVGGYSNIKDKKQTSCYSGVFTLLFSKNKFSEINTFSFGALLVKDSSVNKKYLGEPDLAMNGHIRRSNEHIFFITDQFYPEYYYTNNSSYRGYGYYGYEPVTRAFAGFRFLNAYILEFNTQGTLLNEWYFPVTNVLTQSFYNLVDLYQDQEDNILIYYVYKNEIVSQFMNGQHILEAQTTIPVELTAKTDLLEYSSNIAMRHWYDNHFLLSGYQYIKSQRGKGKRYVFFLNKLICE